MTRKGINFGKKNPMWKGGRIINSCGYIMLRAEGHPRATKKGFYVFEHILKMEKKLGRCLKGKEEIHHENEIKTDNRISNLKLYKCHAEHNKENLNLKFILSMKGRKHGKDTREKQSRLKKEWWKDKKNRLKADRVV